MVRSLSQKKFRDELGLFVAEGEKCVSELARHFELVLRIDETNATRTEIEQMSNLRTPQGVIGVFKTPKDDVPLPLWGKGSDLVGGKRLLLALDSVQDPGNLGTIIRTADWFGVHDIYCSMDTADCFSPKVVQATMGSLSRVRVHYVDLPAWLREQASPTDGEGTNIYGTLLDGRNMYEDGALPPSKEGIIVMGNEGRGISDEVRSLVTHPLFIPSYPAGQETGESLNVAIATAVILAEFRR